MIEISIETERTDTQRRFKKKPSDRKKSMALVHVEECPHRHLVLLIHVLRRNLVGRITILAHRHSTVSCDEMKKN